MAGWEDTIAPIAAPKAASWEDTIKPVAAAVPENTPATPPVGGDAPAAPDVESGHIFGLDTGTRVSHKDISDLAAKYGTDPDLLEKQAVRYGATYPDATPGQKAYAALYHGGDTLLGNLPSWAAKKFHDGNTEQAIDDLKDTVNAHKSVATKVGDLATGIATPLQAPEAAANALSQVGKYAPALVTGAGYGGVSALANSKQGQEGLDTVEGAAGGGIAGPLLQKGMETGARAVAKTMGVGKAAVNQFLADPAAGNATIGDKNNNFENVQAIIDNFRSGQIADQGAASDAVSAAKDAQQLAAQKAGAARQNYVQSLKSQVVPSDVPSMVDDGLNKQRAVVSGLSTQQMEMLAGNKDKIQLPGLQDEVSKGLDREKVAGQIIPGDKDAQALQALQQVIDQLSPKTEVPGAMVHDPVTNLLTRQPSTTASGPLALSPTDTVKLRQKVGDVLSGVYDQGAGAYTKRSDRVGQGVYAKLNEGLDTQMPNSSEYAALRDKLANETNFSSDAVDNLGQDRKLGLLSSIDNPNNRDKLELLKQLDAKHNLGIMDRLQPFLEAQKTLGDRQSLNTAVAGLPESQAATAAESATADAAQKLQALKDQQAPYASITPGNSSQTAIRNVLFANENKPQKQTFDALRSMADDSGQDIVGKTNDLKFKNAFGGGGPNGSRLVQLGSKIGGVLGHGGEAVGGMIGGLADYSKGTVAQAALNAYAKLADPAARAASQTLGPVVDKLMASGAAGQGYMNAMNSASARGPQAMLATHAALLKDPQYNQIVGGN